MNAPIMLYNLVSTSCAVTAGILAYHELDGWGWFLFVSVCTYTTMSTPNKEKQ